MSSTSTEVFVTTVDNQYVVDENGRYLLYDPTSGETHYTSATPDVCAPFGETTAPAVPLVEPQMGPSSLSSHNERTVSTFTNAATKCFLNLLLERKEKLRDNTIKKKSLWAEISAELKNHNFEFDEHAVERKFRNMKHQFLLIRDNNTKTGRGRKTWGYYELMEELFEKNTCINPKSSLASMTPKKVAIKCSEPPVTPSTSVVSGFDLIKSVHPDTEMLPESSTTSEVKDAVLKRRLNCRQAQNDTPTCKKVRKRGAQKSNEALLKIQAAIEDSNRIQNARNQLLHNLLEKFQNN